MGRAAGEGAVDRPHPPDEECNYKNSTAVLRDDSEELELHLFMV